MEMESFHVPEVSDILLYFIVCLQHLFSSYNKQGDITAKEAKIRFLKVVSTWPTFGCSFFEVKVTGLVKVVPKAPRCFISAFSSTPRQQTCEASFPNAILVVISKQGVGFMDPETKVGRVRTGSGTSNVPCCV